MCTLFLASLTAAAQVSRLITAPPKAVAATAAPVRALAPRKPRRLKPFFSSVSGVFLLLSLMGYCSLSCTDRSNDRLRALAIRRVALRVYHLHYRDQRWASRGFLAAFAALVLHDQWRALVVVVIGHLAIEAVMAFVVVDMPIRVNRLHFTFVG